MNEHPRPWRVEPLSRMVRDANDEPIALLSDEATARLIADAVNGRNMVAVCHQALAELDQTRWNMTGSGSTVAARADFPALSLCREQTAPEPDPTHISDDICWPEPVTRLIPLRREQTATEPLRDRLRNIYHLTLNYGDDPVGALEAIRQASSPGS